jgi:hypothetical protein
VGKLDLKVVGSLTNIEQTKWHEEKGNIKLDKSLTHVFTRLVVMAAIPLSELNLTCKMNKA